MSIVEEHPYVNTFSNNSQGELDSGSSPCVITPWLAYPPEVARTFPAPLAELAGYRAHRPNLGTFEGRCPSTLLGGPPTSALGAVDALRPDQEALIEQFHAGLLPAGLRLSGGV